MDATDTPSFTDADTSTIEVDCDTCMMQHSEACEDCLVTFICDRAPAEAVVITIDELRSMRVLSDAGLVPSLRHRARLA